MESTGLSGYRAQLYRPYLVAAVYLIMHLIWQTAASAFHMHLQYSISALEDGRISTRITSPPSKRKEKKNNTLQGFHIFVYSPNHFINVKRHFSNTLSETGSFWNVSLRSFIIKFKRIKCLIFISTFKRHSFPQVELAVQLGTETGVCSAKCV